MNRLPVLLLLSLASVGCFGACGSSDSTSRASAETTSSGADTTEPTTAGEHEPTIVVGTDTCASDADCVPAGCCHPSACVSTANAPSCGESVCTTDCRFGTLDCGGACLCQQGHCAARLSQLPNIPGVSDVQ